MPKRAGDGENRDKAWIMKKGSDAKAAFDLELDNIDLVKVLADLIPKLRPIFQNLCRREKVESRGVSGKQG